MKAIKYLSLLFSLWADAKDIPCEWKSLTGVSYDLKKLSIRGAEESYYIRDGDIPCTPETEPTYSFVWNICADITKDSYPPFCPKEKTGSALQYVNREDGYKECEVIGHYDAKNDDAHYKLLNEQDPSAGVSMTYRSGDKCPGGVLRSATIDIQCANEKLVIMSALEPSVCQYHLSMKSYHGCPKSCPVTGGGLCNSHGHCAYDKSSKRAYCYCNEGYVGEDCSQVAVDTKSYDGSSVQLGLMVVLLIITIGLVAVVGFMIFKINEYRKQQAEFSQLPQSEMVDANRF